MEIKTSIYSVNYPQGNPGDFAEIIHRFRRIICGFYLQMRRIHPKFDVKTSENETIHLSKDRMA